MLLNIKIRIVPSSTGTKGKDWQRIYKLQIKNFIIWQTLAVFKTMGHAQEYLKERDIFGNAVEIIYKFKD